MWQPGQRVILLPREVNGTQSSQASPPSSPTVSVRAGDLIVRLRPMRREHEFMILGQGPTRPPSPSQLPTPPRRRRRGQGDGAEEQEGGVSGGKRARLGVEAEPNMTLEGTGASLTGPSGASAAVGRAYSTQGDGDGVSATPSPAARRAEIEAFIQAHRGWRESSEKVGRSDLQALLIQATDYVWGTASMPVARAIKAWLIEWRARPTGQEIGLTDAVTEAEEACAVEHRPWLGAMPGWDVEFVTLHARLERTKANDFIRGPSVCLAKARMGWMYKGLQTGARPYKGRTATSTVATDVQRWLFGNDIQRFRGKFKHQVITWRRWQLLTARLSPGVTGLLPPNAPRTWFEQPTRKGELEAWIAAVEHFRPEVRILGEALGPLLDRAQRQETLPGGVTLIERWDGSAETLDALGPRWFEPAEGSVPDSQPLRREGEAEENMEGEEENDEEAYQEHGAEGGRGVGGELPFDLSFPSSSNYGSDIDGMLEQLPNSGWGPDAYEFSGPDLGSFDGSGDLTNLGWQA
jgi:hypothetical protein